MLSQEHFKRLCELNALPTATALVGFSRQCFIMSEKTPTALPAELSANKAELKKNKVFGARTGEVGVPIGNCYRSVVNRAYTSILEKAGSLACLNS